MGRGSCGTLPQKGVAGKGGVGVAEGKGWFRSTTRAKADQGSDTHARTPPLPCPPTPHAPLTDNAVGVPLGTVTRPLPRVALPGPSCASDTLQRPSRPWWLRSCDALPGSQWGRELGGGSWRGGQGCHGVGSSRWRRVQGGGDRGHCCIGAAPRAVITKVIVGLETGRFMWVVEKEKGEKMTENGRRIFTRGRCSRGAIASQ